MTPREALFTFRSNVNRNHRRGVFPRLAHHGAHSKSSRECICRNELDEDQTSQLPKARTVEGWDSKPIRIPPGKTTSSGAVQTRPALTEAFKKRLDKEPPFQASAPATTTFPKNTCASTRTGDGISTRYFKQIMLISETNGRISELRAELEKKNMTIESSSVKDAYGFRYQRLKELPSVYTRDEILAAAREAVAEFDSA